MNSKLERKKVYNKEIAKKIKEILQLLPLDDKDENFHETDRRLTQVLEDFTYADTEEGKEYLKYLFTRKFKSKYKGMVVCKNIKTFGLCPHHILPINYTINFAYIPDEHVLGLSKIIDAIKLLCKSPKLQEDLTDEISDIFMREIKCKGCMCVIEGQHSCFQLRDVEARETSTVTSSVRGEFFKPDLTKGNPREEFLRLINLKGGSD